MTITETGLFWLPETPDETVPGRLEVDDDGVTTVDFLGSITPLMKFQSRNPENGAVTMVRAEDPPNFVVHGVLMSSPNAVTLIDCWTPNRTQTRTKVRSIERQVVRAGRMVRGDFITGNDAKFTGVRVRVDSIDSWASLRRVGFDETPAGGVSVYIDPAQIEPAVTTQGAKLELHEDVVSQTRGSVEGTVKRTVWVAVTDLDGLTFGEISSSYVTPIVAYASFCLGVSVPLIGLELLYGDTWVSVTHQNMVAEPKKSVKTHEVLLPLTVTGLGILSQFLDVYAKVGPAIPITEDALSNEHQLTLDTMVLELTTVAEGLHRDLHPDRERMSKEDADRLRGLIAEALKDEEEPRYKQIVSGTVLNFLEEPNYKSRLVDLANEVAEALPGLTGKTKKWAERVDDARNAFAHRKHGFIDDSKIDEMYVVSQSLKWLFWGRILLEAGVPAAVIRERMENKQELRFFLDTARQALPEVYGE